VGILDQRRARQFEGRDALARLTARLSPPVASLTRAKVEVTDNQVEAALKTLKKVMIKGGLYQEMKRRVYYEKPSVKRKRKQAQARKKRRRALKRSRVDDED
jgi:small subunit ribosomal protein S21